MHFKYIAVVVLLYYVTDATNNILNTIINETQKLLPEKITVRYI